MSSRKVLVPDKLQFPTSAVATGNSVASGIEVMHQQHQAHRPQFFHMDERDVFISWLRGEFAAANAMIDSLCHHLRSVGDPGEYDSVIGVIQQRRCNWNQILHMQQYFSVAEVGFGLQQVAIRRQQQQHQHHQAIPRYNYDQLPLRNTELKRTSSTYYNKGNKGGGASVKELIHYSAANGIYSEKSDEVTSIDSNEKLSKSVIAASDDKIVGANANDRAKVTDIVEDISGAKSYAVADSSQNHSGKNESGLCTDQFNNGKLDIRIAPRMFNASELIDGNMVNVVEGLKLYDQLLDDSEVSNLVSLVNGFRTAGRKGQFLGQTYVVARRPTRGHGREIIQFGIPVVDSPAEDERSGLSKEKKVESIPSLLQDVIDRMIENSLTNLKPDCCIIDIYNEGDHSQPYLWPPSYGKCISTLTLTDCEMIFGRVIVSDQPGDYKGSLKLSLGPGALLVMEGKSSEFARHALPSIRKQRMLVTFIKTQPKKINPVDSNHRHAVTSSSHWIPPPSRSPNHVRHSGANRAGNHFASMPSTGVLLVPSIRSPIPSPNGIQPLFVTAPVAAQISFPSHSPIPPVSTGWAATAPRHPGNHLGVTGPGTGVFLPPPGSDSESGKETGSERLSNGEDSPLKAQMEDNIGAVEEEKTDQSSEH